MSKPVYTTLGSILNLRRGHDLTKEEMKTGIIPVVGSNGIIGYHNEYTTKAPCLVVGRSGSVGAVNYYNLNCWAHNTTLYTDDFKGNNPKYIYYLLLNLDLAYLHSGSVVPSLNRNYLHPLKVPFYSQRAIQDSIESVLSSLDSKIELNNRINAELEAMAKTLYDYWFVQFDFPDQNGKPYKSSGGKMVYNDQLKRDIPDRWVVKSLPDIATFTNGLACQKFRPTSEKYLNVIKIKEMRDGFTDSSEQVRDTIPSKVVVEDGDILFSWSASLLVILWSGGKGGLNQHIFKVTSDTYPKSFVFTQLSEYVKHFVKIAESRKTTMGHITQDHLDQSRIAVPPSDVISKFDNAITPILKQQVFLQKQNQQLAELRDWLLPMLMNGQVSVS